MSRDGPKNSQLGMASNVAYAAGRSPANSSWCAHGGKADVSVRYGIQCGICCWEVTCKFKLVCSWWQG
jgi:hypothetical protein